MYCTYSTEYRDLTSTCVQTAGNKGREVIVHEQPCLQYPHRLGRSATIQYNTLPPPYLHTPRRIARPHNVQSVRLPALPLDVISNPPADKHFINDPTDLVASALRSIPATNPSLALDAENKIIYTRTQAPHHVALVSGGGAGHEPSFVSSVPQPRGHCTIAQTN